MRIVAAGLGGRSIGMVLKDVSTTYAYTVRYQATLYDAQGAQVGVFSVSEANLLPGETVAVGAGGDTTAPAVRFALTPDPRESAPCAYPIVNASKQPAPVPSAPGIWTKPRVDPKYAGQQYPGEVTGTLQVQPARQGLQAQAVLYDSAGHVSGFESQQLTTADGPTPVRIVFRESFTYSGFPNPWAPVAQATVSAYDDLRTLTGGGLGECQRLQGSAPVLTP
ncbi:MAG TPA: hypothetical protein VHK65_06335 [Candidatus Dormibacteraeota bacterium]|nr:hypothetical protein [Candidatus Dormibacteraeota bacterium]